MDIFSTEKESTRKNSIPKDRIYLREISNVAVFGQEHPKQFYLSNIDGSQLHYLEAPSELECSEWVFALNAVLFGKGSNGSKSNLHP